MSGLGMLAPMALIALAPLAGAIILLYLLKLRRREMVVPSVFLWQRAVDDVQANAPFQKLRPNLLLLLQLAALTALVVGLAAPFVMARRLPGRTVVVVLDASASMRADDTQGPRFEQARRKTAQIMRAMSRRDEVALVECAARARVIVPLTTDKRRLLSGLESRQPTDCPGNIRDGLLLGLSLAAKRPRATVYLVSDGAFGPLPEVQTSAEIRFITVGERNDNVALLAFEAARPAGSKEHQVFVRLRNYAAEPRECVLSIYHEEDLIDARRLKLSGDESRIDTYAATINEPGLLRAELEMDDDLASDNVAYTPVTPTAARSVLLVGPGNLFLEQAMLVLPEVEVFKKPSLSAPQAEEDYEQHDIVIFDRTPVPVPPRRGAVMMIATGGWPETASPGAQLKRPAISRWEKDHPALRYVNLGAVEIAQAQALEIGTDAEALAYCGDAPVIAACEKPDLRALAFGWNFLDSDLPLRVGFPVLLSNVVRWLGEAGGGEEAMVVRPGETRSFTAAPGVTQAQVELPDGQRRKLELTAGQVVFADSDRVGVYRLTAGHQKWRWAVDLRDPGESDLEPRRELQLGARRVATGVSELRTERHFWPYLAFVALLVLVAEWHFYHRRY